MANWQSLQMAKIIPPEIPQALSTVTDIVDQFITLQRTAINIAKVYAALLDSGKPDILKVLINAVVDVIEGILQAGKIHVLFVPITKITPDEVRAALPPTLEDLTIELGWDIGNDALPFSKGAITAYTELAGASGGNKGFFNAFMQSMNDALDPNRPQYLSPNDAVTMTVLLLGAPSFSAAAGYAAAMSRIFKPPTNSDLSAGAIPVPRDLKVRVISSPNTPKIAVRIDWNPAPPIFQPPYFPGVAMHVKRYAVIRSTNPSVAGAASVLDIFSTQALKKGTTSDDKDKTSKVVATGSGLNSTYIDDEEELDADASYYYCVAWEVEITEHGATTTYPFDKVSNVAKTRVRVPVPIKGVPPDWMAYGSPLALMPDVYQAVLVMLERIRALGDRQGGGVSGALKNTLDMLLANLDRLAKQLDEMNSLAKRLIAMFGAPMPGIFTTSITGTGGNAFLIGELASRLNDKSDASRPPYDGDEYVLGLCIVAGGPRIPDIQPIIDLLAALFQPDQTTDPLFDVLTSLDAVVDVVEQHVFGQDMKSIPIEGTGTTTTNPDGTTTHEGGQITLPVPLPAGDGTTLPAGTVLTVEEFDNTTGLPKAPDRPAIADDGTAVATDDPKNPDAGETGVKDPSEVC